MTLPTLDVALAESSSSQSYEVENMRPSQVCADVAAATTRLLLVAVPRWAVPFGEKVVATLLFDRLRESILVPAPSPRLRSFVHAALRFRAFFIRHCLLPRRDDQPEQVVPNPDSAPAFPPGYIPESEPLHDSRKEGRYAPMSHPESFNTEPW